MRRLTANTAITLMIIGVMSFWAVRPFFSTEIMLEIASNMLLGVAFGLALRWILPAYRALKEGGRSGVNFLSIALCGIGVFTFLHRGWVNVIRWWGEPAWAETFSVTAFAVWCVMVSMTMVLLAPGTDDGRVPKENLVWLLTSVSVGSLAAGIMIGASFFS